MGAPGGRERILVVDDSRDTVEVLQRFLQGEGYAVRVAYGVAEAMRRLDEGPVDLVITDVKMPRESGLTLARHVRENLGDTAVLVITGYATIEGAVEAMKTGADNYLPKPFTNEELKGAVRRALDRLPMRRAASGGDVGEIRPDGLVGQSDAIRRLFADIERVPEGAPVLVSGEAGSGRMAVARAIHLGGRRAGGPFVPVCCGAVPATLMAGLLDGRDGGLIRMAAQGTLVLSDVDRMPPDAQQRLLTEVPVQAGEGGGPHLIATTSADLAALSSRGTFDPALRTRLGTARIEVPPLRDRGDDVALLAIRFATIASTRTGRAPMRFTEAALQALCAGSWPGNVRELSDLVERLAALLDVADVTDLPPSLRFSARPAIGGNRTLAEVEADHVRAVLAAVDGNKTRAAQILGIDRKTLRDKVGGPDEH